MISERELRELTELVRETMKNAQPFKPFASFDKRNDRIVVWVRDCSSVEMSDARSLLTLFKDNYAEGYAGFSIEYAYVFCNRHNLNDKGAVSLPKMLDALASVCRADKE